jgi:hypothetical protein
MNIKHCIKQVASLAAVVLSSSKLASRLDDCAIDLDEAFRLQAKFDGVVGAKSVNFGTVSVSKTFKKFFADDEAAVLASLWSVVVSVDKSKYLVLADLRPSPTTVATSLPRLSASEIATAFAAVVA